MTTSPAEDRGSLQSLRRQIVWLRGVAILALLGVIALSIAWLIGANRSPPKVLRAQGLVITNAQGQDRILIGAPALATTKLAKKYGVTNSIVFLEPGSNYRLALGQSPSPVVNGKAIKRLGGGNNYGMTLYDTHGNERGSMAYLGGARRAIVSLDRPYPAEDAVAMIVNDKTGFAGVSINYASGNYSGIVLGTEGRSAWMRFRDPQHFGPRAELKIDGLGTPQWKFMDAPQAAAVKPPAHIIP